MQIAQAIRAILRNTDPRCRMDPMKSEVFRSRVVHVCFAILLIFLAALHAQAQLRVLRVSPHQTDPTIVTVHGPNIAVYDPQVASRHRLFLFLAGTNGKASASLKMDSVFANWGFHAISLDYEDTVIAVSCAHSLDTTTFGRYRRAIVTGAPVSSIIKVDTANSILTRFTKLLAYLVKHDPDGGWGQYFSHGEPVWRRIIVAGHSQGAGHAAYIGKMFRVDRVLMFSGPQDYMDNLHKPAPWQAQKSATPPSRFFAFLNLKDPFNVHHQIANCMLLMHLSTPKFLMVQPGKRIHGHYQILINNYPTKQHHGSTLFLQFANVWNYMATTQIR